MSKSPFSNNFMGQKIALKMVLLSLKLTYAKLSNSQGKYVDQITVVSRFSGLGPSTSKGPLNRDSPLNGIIPNHQSNSVKRHATIFLRVFKNLKALTCMLLGCLWHLLLPFSMTISVKLIGSTKTTVSKENYCLQTPICKQVTV